MTEEELVFSQSVNISLDNKGISKDNAKCIDCGACAKTCLEVCGIRRDEHFCLACGQCILTCPTKALKPKSMVNYVKQAILNKKIVIASISPAVRVSIGDAFGFKSGEFLLEQTVSLLKHLGFTYVFDTTFGADLTIMEEAHEFLERLKTNKLPLFTSCCPAWVKYCKKKFKDYAPLLSTCKSPIGMQQAVIKKYFKDKEIVNVAITPCTAKKDEDNQMDYVLTVNELVNWAKEEHIDFKNIFKTEVDVPFKSGSFSSLIFGSSKGVSTAVLKTAYYFMNNKPLEMDEIVFKNVDGYKDILEAVVYFDDFPINVLVVYKLSNIFKLQQLLKVSDKTYHLVEVMNCPLGCIGGGGNIKNDESLEKRSEALFNHPNKIMDSYQNEEVKKIYDLDLEKVGSQKAIELLHSQDM